MNKISNAFILGFVALYVSSCGPIMQVGTLDSGEKVFAEVEKGEGGYNKVSIHIDKDFVCTGKYMPNREINERAFPLSCDNKVTGSAKGVVIDMGKASEVFDLSFELSDGKKGNTKTATVWNDTHGAKMSEYFDAKADMGRVSNASENNGAVAYSQPFLVQNMYVEINSVGGATVGFYAVNNSPKTIKYIYYSITPYNAVGDAQSDSISGLSTKNFKDTGPYETNILIMGGWLGWYNSTIRCAVVRSIRIQYMDGTEKTYNGQAEVQSTFAPGLRNSCAVQ